tara:strand:+ start:561 stop:1001 length:441 start_codon:yes stop_codon:yes gene_type:complete
MSDVSISRQGPPETVLPAEDETIINLLENAVLIEDDLSRRAELNRIAGMYPSSIQVWKTIAQYGRDIIESYAAYRVGYHRGLDALRKNGWRGSGYVRWMHQSNQAFLTCLSGLQIISEEIGDQEESDRCFVFLLQLEPDWLNVNSP